MNKYLSICLFLCSFFLCCKAWPIKESRWNISKVFSQLIFVKIGQQKSRVKVLIILDLPLQTPYQGKLLLLILSYGPNTYWLIRMEDSLNYNIFRRKSWGIVLNFYIFKFLLSHFTWVWLNTFGHSQSDVKW